MSILKNVAEDLKLKVELLMAQKKYGSHKSGLKISTAGKKGLQLGKVSELTVIAPLKSGGADRLRKIIELIDGDFGGAILVGTLHDMRFVFLENDTKLLFCTAFDGDWDVYIEDFATKIPELMDLIFESVEGWPGIKDPSVKQFILDHQHTADAWFVAYPNLTVNDILRNEKIVKGLYQALDDAQDSEKS
ncbi:hypothetical protein [Pedobacter sp.]